jgi:hypothetical protein
MINVNVIDFKRIVTLLTKPKDYWNEVLAEPGDLKAQLVPRILVLAAIPAVAQFLGHFLGTMALAIKVGIFGRLLVGGLLTLILSYALNVATWVALAYIINLLAASFNAQRDLDQAAKLSTGAMIPVWTGGLLSITTLAPLAWLGSLAGLGYGAYILYLGLPVINGTPQDKAVVYTVATIAILFLVTFVLALVVGCPMGCLMASVAFSGL